MSPRRFRALLFIEGAACIAFLVISARMLYPTPDLTWWRLLYSLCGGILGGTLPPYIRFRMWERRLNRSTDELVRDIHAIEDAMLSQINAVLGREAPPRDRQH